MNAIQESKLTMYTGVDACLTEFTPQVNGIPALAAAAVQLRLYITELTDAVSELAGTITGIADAKAQAKDTMCRLTSTVASLLHAYAHAENDPQLAAQTNVSYSTLIKIRDELADDECQEIYSLADGHIANLQTSYGYSAAMHSNLSAAIVAFRDLVDKPKKAIADKRAFNKMLEPIFDKIDNLLKTRIDKLMVIFENTHPEFAAKYRTNRSINDPANTHTQIKGIVKDRSGLPLPGVKVELKNAGYSGTVFTNEEGEYHLVLKNGVYELLASKDGHPTYAKSNLKLKLGQITHTDVTMENQAD